MKRTVILLSAFVFIIQFILHFPALSAEQPWRYRISASAMDIAADDVSEEVRFGREVAARLLGRYGLYNNDLLTRYVNLVGHALAMNAGRPELSYYFGILNTSEINAYAAPGGYVLVTRGALEKMQDEAELAGVLAHEITHINERHVVRELNIRASEGSAVSGLARLIGGGTETARIAFYQAVDKALDVLLKVGYKREDEVQADIGAAQVSALSGYDPGAITRYFERISALKGKTTEILDKTHPSYESRIAVIRDTIAKESMDQASYRSYKERFSELMKQMK